MHSSENASIWITGPKNFKCVSLVGDLVEAIEIEIPKYLECRKARKKLQVLVANQYTGRDTLIAGYQ